ncbi:hypothetical protein IPL68_05055 [Candidatus Saccharibacteria bacterium]|nr:MAG: hypothetical protein IPL68_05055 [Candidatus Saccharibacteria bacterium]
MSKTITVIDTLQNYQYQLDAPEGRQFADDFKPDLTPRQMLELGVFSHYFEGEQAEFPAKWFAHARLSAIHDPKINYFQVDASQTREEWQRKGWIYAEDPRGWFQWYCRYYLGRRIPSEDTRQINRWKNMSRHVSQVKKYCKAGDELCRPRQRQALLHWAYDSRKL